jgi:hypothetical protein
VGAEAASSKLPGQYSVPVEEARLEPAAIFPTDYTLSKRRGRIVGIRYNIPEELTGAENKVALKATKNDPNHFVDEDAKSDCHLQDAKLNCTIQYGALRYNIRRRDTLIGERFPEAEAADRRFVADIFFSEPGGIIEIFMDGK